MSPLFHRRTDREVRPVTSGRALRISMHSIGRHPGAVRGARASRAASLVTSMVPPGNTGEIFKGDRNHEERVGDVLDADEGGCEPMAADATSSEGSSRRVLVTGASSGIGAATVRHLRSLGLEVVAAARRKERLEGLAVETGCEAYPIDITSDTEVAALASHLEATGGWTRW